MKKQKILILAVALASGFTLAGQVRADVARTPKGESLMTPSITANAAGEPDLVRSQPPTGNARAVEVFRHPVIGAASGNDQIVSERPVYTGRNPFRELREFEIAPLAKPGKECSSDCQKPCCEKK